MKIKMQAKVIAIMCMLFVLLLQGQVFAKDKVIATKNINAIFLRSEVGDYNHAVFLINNKEIVFWCSSELVELLDNYKGKEIKIIY